MPILEFENRNEADLVLTVSPGGTEHTIPFLARAGVRYVLKEGELDRSATSLRDQAIDFWCNADAVEVDIVYPSLFDQLSWDLWVKGGWCGGIVDGRRTTVSDLIPASGTLEALEFFRLVIRAEGWPEDAPVPDRHLEWITAKFVKYFGSEPVSVDRLQLNLARTFDEVNPE